MRILRAARAEVRGAWRSLQYDLTRRSQQGAPPAPDPSFDPFEGGPRRVIVSAGVAALVVGGAVGSYFGVVNGLGSLLDRPPAPGALPSVTGDSDDVTAPAAAPAPGRQRGTGISDLPGGATGGSRVPGAGLPGTTPGAVPPAAPVRATPVAIGRATVPPAPPAATSDPDVPVPTPAPSYECEEPPQSTSTPTPYGNGSTPSPDASQAPSQQASGGPDEPASPSGTTETGYASDDEGYAQ